MQAMGFRFLKNFAILSLQSYKSASMPVFFGVMLLVVSWCNTCVESAISIPDDDKFPALLMFGDSIADPGNNNNMKTPSKADFPPNGKDFKGGIPSGRFCNGKITGDFIASELSIKEYLPAYLDPSLQPEDIITGVSFASGGSGYDPLSPLLALAIPLPQQLDFFKEYKSKLYSIVGENQTNYIIARGLFGVVSSTNDILNAYYMSGIQREHYDILSYTSLMAIYAAHFYADLYAEGARRIMILNALPLGCLPSQRSLSGGLERECVEEYNQAAQIFNSKLASVVESFNSKYSDAKAVILDVYNPLLNVIKNPKQNGFDAVDKGCCGTGLYEVAIFCNPVQQSETCPDASKYVFWDTFHPTEATYKHLITNNIGRVLPQLF